MKKPHSELQSKCTAQPALPQRKADHAKNKPDMGKGRLSRAIFLRSAHLPRAAEMSLSLILPTHEKLQQR